MTREEYQNRVLGCFVGKNRVPDAALHRASGVACNSQRG
ncbi:unknown [Firmicutes bacterium CAG:95]|nr:unknown [Firmicutes bacterium CAG:95]